MKNRVTVSSLIISAVALVSIASYEGYRGEAYKDVAGVPTIGYGETKGVKMGQTTTPDRALVQLLKSASGHADQIRPLIKVPLYQHEFDAYASFAYNVGVGSFAKSTLLKKLNAGDYEGACGELKRWVYAGGKKQPGLVKRREAEYRMCMGEE